MYQSKCHKFNDREDSSRRLEKKASQGESFVSGTWLLTLAACTICISLGGFLLHWRVEKSKDALLVKGQLPETAQAAAKAGSSNFLLDEQYKQCNAAMPPSELSETQPDAALTGPRCGEAEAASIARALRSAGFTFEAAVPKPYIFPSYLQQVLSLLKGPTLAVALKHLQTNAPAGKVATLLKLFAWGLPVPEADLDAALDSSAMDALLQCRFLAPCSKLPGMTTSSVALFPVPKTDLLVATDWASKSLVGMSEEIVPIVDPEGMALVYNSPPPKGLKVLDLDSGSGIHGLMAAHRGASSATIFTRGARTERFARFSSWLNQLSGVVEIVNGPAGAGAGASVADARRLAADVLKPGNTDVLMAQPPFTPLGQTGRPDGTQALRDVFAVAQKVLAPGGQLALVSEFASVDFTAKLCSDFGLAGFMGSLVMKRNPVAAEAYAAAHDDSGNAHQLAEHMKATGVRGVSSGFLFAKRAEKELLNSKGCGSFSLQTLINPMAWPQPGDNKFMRPCFLSQETQCPDAAQ